MNRRRALDLLERAAPAIAAALLIIALVAFFTLFAFSAWRFP